jgi:hypothetical protein
MMINIVVIVLLVIIVAVIKGRNMGAMFVDTSLIHFWKSNELIDQKRSFVAVRTAWYGEPM